MASGMMSRSHKRNQINTRCYSRKQKFLKIFNILFGQCSSVAFKAALCVRLLTFLFNDMTSFGSRLKKERVRLGLTQSEMARLAGGISTGSQIGYEGGSVAPSANYLAHLCQLKVDINYLLVGSYQDSTAAPDLAETAIMFNQLPPTQKALAFAVISLFQEAPVKVAKTGAKAGPEVEGIWRAARLFRRFLALSEQSKLYVETAARIDDELV